MAAISIVIPAYNEQDGIVETVNAVQRAFVDSPHTVEIIVVDDHSQDKTGSRALETDARVIRHPTNKGYGNALLTGIRNATHDWIGITDADGTYPVSALPRMLTMADADDFDMLVGARQGKNYYESALKFSLRMTFRWLCAFVVGQSIPDVNSGLRVIRRDLVTRFASVLSGGFSFTTSITIIAFQTGHHVAYWPIDYYPRKGKSHVNLRRDSLRALQIIVMTIILFNPIKIFLLLCADVLLGTVVGMVFLVAVPSADSLIYLAALGFYAAHVLLALGFLAIRHQSGLDDIAVPTRGYVPRDEMRDEATPSAQRNRR